MNNLLCFKSLLDDSVTCTGSVFSESYRQLWEERFQETIPVKTLGLGPKIFALERKAPPRCDCR